MKSSAPTLLPLMRSDLQAEILARVMLWPDEEQSIADLARWVDASPVTVLREVNRAEEAGLVRSRMSGRNRLVRAVLGNPVASAVVLLLEATYGPSALLQRELVDVQGISRALIYGSWADRRSGNPGSVPHDIDLLVIGEPDRVALAEALERVEARIRREVNVVRLSDQRWEDSTDPFIQTVWSRPVIELDLRREIVPHG